NSKKKHFTFNFFVLTFQLISKIAPFPPTVCQASSTHSPVESRLVSYSAGVSQISSILLGFRPYKK
ncbi:hypothetical protein, partial [Peribacillus frigoritolerans]|uniref:hypothetical protein n=1 Tax=Peribacillus frigoritolerans TaxID=450367 RepID=UPI002E24477A|nr:hypothetical protein [Peribacillus frigoritolerans]